MYSQFPSVTKSLYHFWFLGQIVISVLYHVLIYKRLEIGAVLDAVGRVNVHHLHLPGHALFLQQGVHDHQTVPGDHAVGPVHAVLIELNGLPPPAHPLRRSFRREQVDLALDLARLRLGVFLGHPGDDVQRLDGFVDVDGGGRHLKAHALRLARPLERGVQVRIELVGLELLLRLVVLGHAHRRIVGALLVIVGVGLDVAHLLCVCQLFSRPRHLLGLLYIRNMDHFTRLCLKKFIKQDSISLFRIG